MRYVVAAGTLSEARDWGRQHGVRPCDLLVVEGTSDRPAADLVDKAAGSPLYGVPVVWLCGWRQTATEASTADLDRFLTSLRPPLVRVA